MIRMLAGRRQRAGVQDRRQIDKPLNQRQIKEVVAACEIADIINYRSTGLPGPNHSGLCLGGGLSREALFDGVKTTTIKEQLQGRGACSVYRIRKLTERERHLIAEKSLKLNRPYDFGGFAGQWLDFLAWILTGKDSDKFTRQLQSDDTMYCSELVAHVYQRFCRVSAKEPKLTAPHDLVNYLDMLVKKKAAVKVIEFGTMMFLNPGKDRGQRNWPQKTRKYTE